MGGTFVSQPLTMILHPRPLDTPIDRVGGTVMWAFLPKNRLVVDVKKALLKEIFIVNYKKNFDRKYSQRYTLKFYFETKIFRFLNNLHKNIVSYVHHKK